MGFNMDRNLKLLRRHVFSGLLILACMCIGGLGGDYAAEEVRQEQAEEKFDAYVKKTSARVEQLSQILSSVFKIANASPYLPCSVDDRNELRQLLFHNDDIKDIGRFVDGHLVCSTTLGSLMQPMPLQNDQYVSNEDGTRFYPKLPLIGLHEQSTIIHNGRTNIVLSPSAFQSLDDSHYLFAIWGGNLATRQMALLYGGEEDTLPVLNYGLARIQQQAIGNSQSTRVVKWTEENFASEVDCSWGHGLCIVVKEVEKPQSIFDQWMRLLLILMGASAGAALAGSWISYRNRDRSLSARLLKALRYEELIVQYQPVVCIKSGRLAGFEALIRWEIEKGDFVPPDIFVSRAEEGGFVGLITAFVIKRVMQEMGSLLRGHPHLRINVNITAADLEDPDFIDFLEGQRQKEGLEAKQIGIELTERSAVAGDAAIEALGKMREKGYPIYIDDFGTGYSSLAYLGTLPIDVIKIDRAFTQTIIKTDGEAVSIMPQIIAIAVKHNLAVVVEGVETQEQADYLGGFAMEVAGQGWFYGKPANAAEARKRANSEIPRPDDLD